MYLCLSWKQAAATGCRRFDACLRPAADWQADFTGKIVLWIFLSPLSFYNKTCAKLVYLFDLKTSEAQVTQFYAVCRRKDTSFCSVPPDCAWGTETSREDIPKLPASSCYRKTLPNMASKKRQKEHPNHHSHHHDLVFTADTFHTCERSFFLRNENAGVGKTVTTQETRNPPSW